MKKLLLLIATVVASMTASAQPLAFGKPKPEAKVEKQKLPDFLLRAKTENPFGDFKKGLVAAPQKQRAKFRVATKPARQQLPDFLLRAKTENPFGDFKKGIVTAPQKQKIQSREGEIDASKILDLWCWADSSATFQGLINMPSTATEMRWGVTFPEGLMKKYVGNTIDEIAFYTTPGTLTNCSVWVMNLATSQIVWQQSCSLSEFDANVITCTNPYTITGEPVMVGYTAYVKSPSYSNYPVATCVYPTSVDGGAYFYDGGQWHNTSTWFYEDCYAANFIQCYTSGEAGRKANDLTVIGADGLRGELAGENQEFKVSLRNYGTTDVSSFDYTYEVDGNAIGGTVNLDTRIGFLGTKDIAITEVKPNSKGVYTGAFAITNVNGGDDGAPEDNAAEVPVVAIDSGVKRINVIEEWTSTEGGWCPRGIVGLEKIKAKYPKSVIPISVHTWFSAQGDDPLEDTSYKDVLAKFSTGFPSATINREHKGLDSYKYFAELPGLLNGRCEAQIGIATGEADMGESISITPSVQFNIDVPEDYYGLAYVITQDSITGVDQLNYYYGAPDSYFEGADDLKFLQTVTPTDQKQGQNSNGGTTMLYYYQPTFNDIARTIDSPWGTEYLLPACQAGEKVTFAPLTIPRPSGMEGAKAGHINITALLIDQRTGAIVTANRAKYGEDGWIEDLEGEGEGESGGEGEGEGEGEGGESGGGEGGGSESGGGESGGEGEGESGETYKFLDLQCWPDSTVSFQGLIEMPATATEMRWGVTFPEGLMKKYVGNTIDEIAFYTTPGTLTNCSVWVMNLATSQIVWQQACSLKEFENNVITCTNPYTITGDGIMVGYTAYVKSPSYSNYPVAACVYPTSVDGGAYFYHQGYGWINTSDWFFEDCYAANFIQCSTSGPAGRKANDLTVIGADGLRGELAGENQEFKVSLRNYGTTDISSFDYTYEVDGNKTGGTVTLDSLLGCFGTTDIAIAEVKPNSKGIYSGTFAITNVNGGKDADVSDNAAEVPVVALDGGVKRIHVIEEWTSTECGWCPRGVVGLDKIKQAYKDDVIPISVHTWFNQQGDDPLDVPSYEEVLLTCYRGFPDATINREIFGVDPYEAYENLPSIFNQHCEATLGLATEEEDMGASVSITPSIEFNIDVPANYYGLAYVITEDNITGVDQLNYYYGLPDSYFDGADDLKFLQTVTPTDQKQGESSSSGTVMLYYYQPTFNDIARTIDSPWGTEHLLPACKAGEKVTLDPVTIAMPESIESSKLEDVYVTALLIDQRTGVIVTASRAKYGQNGEVTGIAKVETASNAAPVIEVADGAFNVTAENATAKVYTMDGKLVASATVKGSASIPTFGNGAYIIRVEANGQKFAKKAIF